ncbi:transcription factor bHLH160 [Olea europaea var. sylvestris]|uniref:transcription factor bHLH160 n=1 Tax=Olea europaea var. sylvestris TaxID=158386 RepID=UPI000C1D4AFF|nr:transcription factor bHLH160 [Olea europaea var. sylvestris]
MKINASYLALRALIPDYSISRSKERWTAPALVDCVLKYIPELENEIETLKLKKQNYLIQADESTGINSPDQNSQQTGIDSITKVEDEQGIWIQSASTLQVSQNRICYHLHIQTSENSTGVNYVEGLRNKVHINGIRIGYASIKSHHPCTAAIAVLA